MGGGIVPISLALELLSTALRSYALALIGIGCAVDALGARSGRCPARQAVLIAVRFLELLPVALVIIALTFGALTSPANLILQEGFFLPSDGD